MKDMTPKEKAEELIGMFVPYAHSYFNADERGGGWNLEEEKENAKQCALICVDEMINTAPWGSDNKKFLEQVKTEIQSL